MLEQQTQDYVVTENGEISLLDNWYGQDPDRHEDERRHASGH